MPVPAETRPLHSQYQAAHHGSGHAQLCPPSGRARRPRIRLLLRGLVAFHLCSRHGLGTFGQPFLHKVEGLRSVFLGVGLVGGGIVALGAKGIGGVAVGLETVLPAGAPETGRTGGKLLALSVFFRREHGAREVWVCLRRLPQHHRRSTAVHLRGGGCP